MLQIELPLFAFSHCRDVVAEVSKAGGFGCLGATGHTPESLEIELKPKILETFNKITKNYKKLTSYQKEKLEAVLKNETYSESKKKNYERIKKEIMEEMLGLQFNQTTQEDLVNLNYTYNKKALSFDGELMRAATKYGISREDFIKFYVGNELNPNFENFLSEDTAFGPKPSTLAIFSVL